MRKKEEFSSWLKSKKLKKNGEPLKDSSFNKYVNAIDTISKDMMADSVINKDIYYFTDTLELTHAFEEIKNNKNFNIKNETGNNMYSVALDHYEDFFSKL